MARRRKKRPGSRGALGGKGGGCTPNLVPTAQTSDTRLLERALRERWQVPEYIRREGPALLAEVITSKRASARNKIAAFRALVQADAQNLEYERTTGAAPAPPTPASPVNVHVHGDMTLTHEQHIAAELAPYAEALRLVLRGPDGGGERGAVLPDGVG
jgi:hypothetical protein